MQEIKEIFTGTVRFYNQEKGYGFIFPDAGGRDIFFHATGLTNDIKVDSASRVCYNKSKNKKGEIAVSIDLLP